MKRYEYDLYVFNNEDIIHIPFNNLLNIPVPDIIKNHLKTIYDTETVNIYQISNEYRTVLKLYIVDEDDFGYEVTDLYEKLSSKIVNSMYTIFSGREKEYRQIISKNNAAYLMSKWNLLRKNTTLKYESLKKSVDCANIILSGFNTQGMFESDNYFKYKDSERQKISLIEKRYKLKARDKDIINFSENEIENYIKMSYVLKNVPYFNTDMLIKERNEALLNVVLNSETEFKKLFYRLLRRGIYIRKVNDRIRFYTLLSDESLINLRSSFGITSVNDRDLRYDFQKEDNWIDEYFVHYMDDSTKYEHIRNENYERDILSQKKDIKTRILEENNEEYVKIQHHSMYNLFIQMKNLRDRFNRLNDVLSYINIMKYGSENEKKKAFIDKKMINFKDISYYPVTVKYLDSKGEEKESVYNNEKEITDMMYELSEKYVSDFNRKLKTPKNKFYYTRFLYLESYMKKNPSTDTMINGEEKRAAVLYKSEEKVIFEQNDGNADTSHINDCYCDSSDILEYLDINFLTQDKIHNFKSFLGVRANFEYKQYNSTDIINLMKTFGQLGVDISNRIKMFKRDYVKNLKVRKRVDVRLHKEDNTYKRISDIYLHLDFLKLRVKMLSKVKERDIIPMMFELSTIKIPCITASDIRLEVARYKKYSISSKDSVYVVDRTEESKKGDVVIDTDYLMYLSVCELSNIFRYSAIMTHQKDRWNIIRKYAGFEKKKEVFIPELTFTNEIYNLNKIRNALSDDNNVIKGFVFSKPLNYTDVFNIGYDRRTFFPMSGMNILPTVNVFSNTVNELRRKVEKYDGYEFYYINRETAEIMDSHSYLKKVWLNGLRDDEKRRLVTLEKQING